MAEKAAKLSWVRLFLLILDVIGVIGIGYIAYEIINRNEYSKQVAPPALPTAIAITGTPFDHCVVSKDTGLAYQAEAGTPIPASPVVMNTPVTKATEEPTGSQVQPTEAPSATAQQETPLLTFNPKVVDVGEHADGNFHIVFVGIGQNSDTENKLMMDNLIESLVPLFSGIRVDFAYVESPLNIQLTHVDQSVDYNKIIDRALIEAKIGLVHPVNGIFFLLNTNELIGDAMISEGGTDLAFMSSSLGTLNFAHEIGHFLGLGDGYSEDIAYQIPDSELFYADSMPNYLAKALNELGYVPPLYEAGTCNGKKIYTFYESSNNIMGDYNPQGPNSWGESTFTPLQIQIMNDHVREIKGGS